MLWEDREVCINFATASEAAKLPLRKDPTRTGELRIIEIKGYDMSACGGTHVNRTGAIGMIAIPGYERFKGGARIEFVCGVRALQAYRADRNVVTAGVRSLSVLPDELPAAIERMRDANRQQQKGVEAVYDRLATLEAAALASAAETVGAHKLVAAAVSGWDAAGLKKLASAIAANPGTIVVLMTDTDPAKGGHQAPPSMIVVARSQDVTVDAGAVLQHLIGRFGGKGGGKGSMAQGGGLTGDSRDILSAAREHIRSA